jgi:spermidine synthase
MLNRNQNLSGEVLQVVGQHLIVDAFGCKSEIVNDADLLEQVLTKLLQDLGMEILHTYFHRFDPQGVTGAIVISTSHIAIHTWPEQNYVGFDLFTCGNMASWEQIQSLLRALSAQRAVVYQLGRGNVTGTVPTVREIQLQTLISMENTQHQSSPTHLPEDSDGLMLRELLARPHRIMYQSNSENREALLLATSDLRMYLNNQLQFSSSDERIYHEALVHPVLSLAHARDHVLIIGGGNGLALREVLKYPDVTRVHLFDVDPVVLNAAANVPELVALNERALFDPRVQVLQQDAQFVLTRRRRRYNVIVIDLPHPADEVVSRLYTREFFKNISNYLAPDGILVCQSPSPHYAPLVFWSIAETIESAGLPTLSYHVKIDSFVDRGFHIAGHTRPIKRLIKVPVPHRTLPQCLDAWFQFDEDILTVRRNAMINTLEKLTLHSFYQQSMRRKFD